MSYHVSYNGFFSKDEKVVITSGVGNTNLKGGQQLTFYRVDDSLNIEEEFTVSIVKEVKNRNGFIYWENLTSEGSNISSNSVFFSFIVPNDIEDLKNCFIKIEYTVKSNLTNEYPYFNIEFKDEDLFLSFMNLNSYLSSSTIARTGSGDDKNFDFITSPRSVILSSKYNSSDDYQNDSISYDGIPFSTISNSNLKWYKTNKQDYVSTSLYIKNLTNNSYEITYGIAKENGEVADGGKFTIDSLFLPKEVKLLTFCASNTNDLSNLHWEIIVRPTKVTVNDKGDWIRNPFIRFSFVILEEKTIDSNLIYSFVQPDIGEANVLGKGVTPFYLQQIINNN